MKRIVLTLICAITTFGISLPANAVTAPGYTPRNSTTFNNPKGSRAAELAIVTQINRSIDASPRGSTIRMAQYLFNIDSSTDKLIAAYKRGVNVQLLIDDAESTTETRRVIRALGTNKAKSSFVATCRRSCMASTTSVMHAKFYLFSAVGSARLVTMVSSANLYTGNTFSSWNNNHTIVGDAKLYNSLTQYFFDMIKDKDNYNYYRTTTSGKYKLYLFPRAPKPGVNTIAILDVLNHVRCNGVARGYGRNGRTVIRVAMWGWSGARLDIARKLWELHNRGCRVEVLYNSGRTGGSVVRALLKRSPRYGVIPLYNCWVDRNNNGLGELYMHHKLLTVNGIWFAKNAKVVYTGSQNFTGPGTTANNDILFRIIDNATHNAYMKNLNYIRDRHTRRVWQAPSANIATSSAMSDGTRNATSDATSDAPTDAELDALVEAGKL